MVLPIRSFTYEELRLESNRVVHEREEELHCEMQRAMQMRMDLFTFYGTQRNTSWYGKRHSMGRRYYYVQRSLEKHR